MKPAWAMSNQSPSPALADGRGIIADLRGEAELTGRRRWCDGSKAGDLLV